MDRRDRRAFSRHRPSSGRPGRDVGHASRARLRRERVTGTPEEFTLDPVGLPAELRRRLVLAVLAAMGRPAPRGEELTRLLATLGAGGSATLAEVKCAGGGLWRFTPAPPRL